MPNNLNDIKELALPELEAVIRGWGYPAFRARQAFDWIYKNLMLDFTRMGNLPKDLRARLAENFSLVSLKASDTRVSEDGTKKLLFTCADASWIESVIIPAEGRVTGCLSSQVGCKFACRFCASGLKGFKRNLTCGEIIEEAIRLKMAAPQRKLTHLVFMGTGEPLDNYDNILKAVRLINSADTLNIGARRITISTCGIIPGIKRLAGEGLQIELSVSLHSADDRVRTALMPVNKVYPLKELISACRAYAGETGRQVTFEYVLISGVNSDLQSAQKLGRILSGFDCKLNLIPANPIRELNIGPPGKMEALLFQDALEKMGLKFTMRKPRGKDIEAACGQLRLRYEN
jgi:23S rRNA (adenine2503-C2)-methyltransferase